MKAKKTRPTTVPKNGQGDPPGDVYYGRGSNILRMRRKIKQQTLNEWRRRHRQNKVA